MKPRKAASRPDIFRYHDYRTYLNDWLAFLKSKQPGTSLRDIAKKTSLSASYLSMVLSGSRKLTAKAVAALVPVFKLSTSDRAYFDLLVILGNSDSQEERQDAYARMSRLRPYQRNNQAESATYQYLSHWYCVAIREMTALPDFKADPEWIRSKLRFSVELKEIEKALEFLVTHKFIELLPDGKAIPPERSLDCQGGVYRLALTQFHQEMFSLATRSIDTTPSEERKILGYTLAVDQGRYEKVQKAIQDVYQMLEEIAQEKPTGETVIHVELAAFPLTTTKKRDE